MSSPLTTVEHARCFTQKKKSLDLYSWWVFNKMGEKASSKAPLICKFFGLLRFSINCRALACNHQLYLVLLIKSRTAFSLPAEQGKLHAVPVSFYLGLRVSSGLKLSEQSALFILWFSIQDIISLLEKWQPFNVLAKNCGVDKIIKYKRPLLIAGIEILHSPFQGKKIQDCTLICFYSTPVIFLYWLNPTLKYKEKLTLNLVRVLLHWMQSRVPFPQLVLFMFFPLMSV